MYPPVPSYSSECLHISGEVDLPPVFMAEALPWSFYTVMLPKSVHNLIQINLNAF